MSVFFFNTFALPLVSNINILMCLVFNSALKEVDATPQPKSKVVVGARWIVVKVSNLNNAFTSIYFMSVYTNL